MPAKAHRMQTALVCAPIVVIPAKAGIHGVGSIQIDEPHGFRVPLRGPGMTKTSPTKCHSRLARLSSRWPIVALAVLLSACVGIPENVKPVGNFKLEQYLGQWYEIARLDHSFERGMTRVTADYSLREDGGVKVVNRGFLAQENKWKDAEGKAYFVGPADQGHLKVSFFGPFYGSYIVFELDQDNYQYAVVSGPDLSYLWILARSPQMNKETKDRLVAKAAALGFDTARLIFVGQD